MNPVLSRLVVFLLLACDWAADPCQGASLLSAPLASTECYCHSITYRADIARECASAPHLLGYPVPAAQAAAAFSLPAAPNFGPAEPKAELIYVFMSITR
jgi:hypothetical protein